MQNVARPTSAALREEANGHLVEDLPFHQYYSNLPQDDAPATAVRVP